MASDAPFDVASLRFMPPHVTWDATQPAPRYYAWQDVYPFLEPFTRPAVRERMLAELRAAARHAPPAAGDASGAGRGKWFDWPETELYKPEEGESWRVLPFCHCFPAFDESKLAWIDASVRACPFTADLLRHVPGIRTALFSRLGPGVELTPHQGWADLSNHVLRCHVPLYVPVREGARVCGMAVEDEVRYHDVGDILIFDDSKTHTAFNRHPEEARYILIFDVLRPSGLPLGTAVGSTTGELEAFINYFK